MGSFSLARQLQKEAQSTNSSDYTEEQKVIITPLFNHVWEQTLRYFIN